MYNRYTKSTEAWWAMQDAISMHQKMEEVSGDFEDFCENLIDRVEQAEEDRSEMEEERDQLQKELDKYESSPDMLTLLYDLKKATEALTIYVNKKLKELGENVQKSDPDSGSGAAGNGGDEGDSDKVSATPEGVTRPQIP